LTRLNFKFRLQISTKLLSLKLLDYLYFCDRSFIAEKSPDWVRIGIAILTLNILMSDVFISYSRKDKDFVKVLHQALTESKYNAWVDWEDIPLTADWWEEIKAGIERTDTFLFVISPDSMHSKVCNQELDHAIAHNKRLIPIVRRDGFDSTLMRPALGKHNWLFFRGEDNFDSAFQSLVKTLDTDLDHVKRHTRLLVKAIEWEHNQHNPDLLMRGSELENTIQWLAHSKHKEPQATELQTDYILASETWQREEIQRLQTLYEQSEQRRIEAEKNEVKALCKSSEALFKSNREFEALLEVLRAVYRLKTATWMEDDIQKHVWLALQQAVYDVKERNCLEGHNAGVTHVRFSPDGKFIISRGGDGTVKAWDSRGQILQTIRGNSKFSSVALSPDGKSLVTTSEDCSIHFWSLTGEPLQSFKDTHPVGTISFSPDGNMIAFVNKNNQVKLWSTDGEELQVFERGEHVEYFGAKPVSFSPDSKLIAFAIDEDNLNKVTVWNIDGQRLQTFQGHHEKILTVSFSPDGKLIASSGWDRKIKIWAIDAQEPQTLDGGTDNSEPIYEVSFSPDGKLIAAATGDDIVKLWDISGQPLEGLKGHSDQIFSASFSPDSGSIASASADANIKVWRIWNQELQTLTEDSNGFLCVSYSPDGQIIAGGGRNGTITLWNALGQKINTVTGHSNCLNSINFSPDGQFFVTSSNTVTTENDATIKLWNRYGKELQQFHGHNGGVHHVSFSPDGNLIASADGKIIQFDFGTYRVSFSRL
jgi:WD40 repeat protein